MPREKFLEALAAEGVPASPGYGPQYRYEGLKVALESKNFRRAFSAQRLKRYSCRRADTRTGNAPMRIAVPDWQGRVSPVFDVAEQVLLVDLNEEEDSSRRAESLGSTAPHDRARRLTKLGVDVVVCGAISWLLEALLTNSGIRVIPLVCGEVEEVVRAFRDAALEEERFAMAGYCRKRRPAASRRGRPITHIEQPQLPCYLGPAHWGNRTSEAES